MIPNTGQILYQIDPKPNKMYKNVSKMRKCDKIHHIFGICRYLPAPSAPGKLFRPFARVADFHGQKAWRFLVKKLGDSLKNALGPGGGQLKGGEDRNSRGGGHWL